MTELYPLSIRQAKIASSRRPWCVASEVSNGHGNHLGQLGIECSRNIDISSDAMPGLTVALLRCVSCLACFHREEDQCHDDCNRTDEFSYGSQILNIHTALHC